MGACRAPVGWSAALKVLHIITGLDRGGAEAVLANYVLRDTRHAHAVLLLSGPGVHGPRMRAAGVPVQTLGLSRLGAPAGLVRAARLIRAERPDVVVGWMYHAHLASALAALARPRPRIIWSLHSSSAAWGTVSVPTYLLVRANGWLAGLVPDAVKSCSVRAADWHLQAGLIRRPVHVIPNGVDLARFRPDRQARAATRRAMGVPEGTVLLGLVARFHPQKDVPTLLAALSRLPPDTPPWRLLLAGNGLGPGDRGIRSLLDGAGLGDRAILLGPRGDVPDLMNALDTLVLPSAFGEAFPNVLCEAMACGTPCIATDVGDAAMILGDTGRIVPPRDPDALADALQAALAQGAGRRCEAAARRVAERFGLDRMVEALSDLVDALGDSGRP